MLSMGPWLSTLGDCEFKSRRCISRKIGPSLWVGGTVYWFYEPVMGICEVVHLEEGR